MLAAGRSACRRTRAVVPSPARCTRPVLAACLATAILLAAAAPPLLAVDYTYWDRPAGDPGDWHVGDNWDTGLPPSSSRIAVVDNGGTAYILSGTAIPSSLQIGKNLSGHVEQQGGLLSMNYGVTLGLYTGSEGTYVLEDGEIACQDLYVGKEGEGTFSQSAGTVTLTDGLYVGPSGLYELSGSGILNTASGYKAVRCQGTFRQTGGTHTSTDELAIYNWSGGLGTYELAGDGLLTAEYTHVGQSTYDPGEFRQSGGTHTVDRLLIAAVGQYVFTGGTLEVTGRLQLEGKMDLPSRAGQLTFAPEAFGDLRTADTGILHPERLSVLAGLNSLLMFPAGFDPATAFADFSSAGEVHHPGETLHVPTGCTAYLDADFEDHIRCEGTLVTGKNMYGGIEVDGGTVHDSYYLPRAEIYVNDDTSGMTAGRMEIRFLRVGHEGTGQYTQTGGELFLQRGSIVVGSGTGSEGSFVISNGSVEAYGSVYIGAQGGHGTYLQSGGEVQIGSLLVADHEESSGTVELLGGQLDAEDITLGDEGPATCLHSGGCLRASDRFTMGAPGCETTYDMSGTAVLDIGNGVIGYGGTVRFTQDGGTHAASTLELGSDNPGTTLYEMKAGNLTAGALHIGADNEAALVQTGGTVTTGYLTVGPDGRYEYGGDDLDVRKRMKLDGGTLDFDWTLRTLHFRSGATADFSNGQIIKEANAVVQADANTLLIFPSGYDPAIGFREFTSAGVVHIAGSGPLVVPAGRGFTGWGEMNMHIQCYGTIASGGEEAPDALTLTGGIEVFEGGSADISDYVNIRDDSSGLDGGLLTFGRRMKVAGEAAPARFVQTGGTLHGQHDESDWQIGSLDVGSKAQNGGDLEGLYELHGGELDVATLGVAEQGPGTFTQTGGTVNVRGSFWMGMYSDSGLYDLQDGSLTFRVGYLHNTVVFNQAGGTVDALETLLLDEGMRYQLQDGDLAAPEQALDGDPLHGFSVLAQSGGTNTADDLYVSPYGRYELTGGSLQVNDTAVVEGEFHFGLGNGTLDVASDAYVDLSGADVTGGSGTTVSAASGSVVLFPAGFDPDTDLAGYTGDGIVHGGGTPLVIPAGWDVAALGTIKDHVHCEGTLRTRSGETLNLMNGVSVTGSGLVDPYAATVNDEVSYIDSGRLDAYLKVGYEGTGTFTQSGGIVDGDVTLGYHAEDADGTYVMSGGEIRGGISLGYWGTGHFIQTGGTCDVSDLRVGYYDQGTGIYEISGTGRINATRITVADKASGQFIQSGDSEVVVQDRLMVGKYGGTFASYEITGGVLTAEELIIGSDMDATFIQNGGTVHIEEDLALNAGFSGDVRSYELHSGQLTTRNTRVGGSGPGFFEHTGGQHQVKDTLYLGTDAGTGVTYALSGTGILTAGSVYIGYSGTGDFVQGGGSMTADYISVAAGCRYEFTGGALGFGGLYLLGTLDFADADLDVAWDDCYVHLDGGGFDHAENVSLALGPNTLLVHPPEVVPADAFEAFASEGFVHAEGTTLVVPAGRGFVGMGSLYEHVDCAGTVQASEDGWLHMHEGISLSEGGDVDLGTGTLVTPATGSEMTGGTFSAAHEEVSWGTSTQTGGTKTLNGHLFIASEDGSQGTYELDGAASLNCDHMQVGSGSDSEGTFTQTGGTVIVRDRFDLGYADGKSPDFGTYEISAGQFSADRTYMGNCLFRQTGGTVGVNAFRLSWGGTATYELQAGDLLADWAFVGHANGEAHFVQTGGTFTVATELSLAGDALNRATLYELFDGNVVCDKLRIGYRKPATLNQSGGTITAHTVRAGVTGDAEATYNLSGTGVMEADAEWIGVEKPATATHSGGTNRTGYLAVGPDGQYVWTGGVLEVTAGMKVEGTFDADGQAWAVGGESFIMNFAGGSFVSAGGVSMDLGTNSLAIVPAGFDPASAVGSYASAGMTHTAGTTLVVGPGEGFGGSGEIDDHLDCAGTVVAGPGNFIDLHAGVTVRDGGIVDLGWGTMNASGGTTSLAAGTLAAGTLAVGADGPGTFAVTSAAAQVTVSERLRLGSQASLTAEPGTTVHMTGSAFENESTDPSAMAGLANIELAFEGGDGVADPFEVAGQDVGPFMSGFDANFALGALTIGGSAPGHVQLVDAFDNQWDGDGNEALYVVTITLRPGSSLNLNGLNLYYRYFTDEGGSVDLGGGSMMPAPEPATLALLAAGLAAMGLRRRRA